MKKKPHRHKYEIENCCDNCTGHYLCDCGKEKDE